MPKYRVMVGRPCSSGSHRAEIGNWLIEVATVSVGHPRIEDVVHVPIQQCGTDIARNRLVAAARKHAIDVLYMVDDDHRIPEGWFLAAFDFLTAHSGPAVIGCPYVCAPPEEEVQVFEWASKESRCAGTPWGIARVGREDAARRKGIERVDNIGTGCIAYRVDAFDRVEPPYYAYSYNADHTAHVETEDCYCHRHLAAAGVPIFCAWDYWLDHYKLKRCEKPVRVFQEDIDRAYVRAARAEMEHAACRQAGRWAEEASAVVPALDLERREGPYPPRLAVEWARSVEGWMHPDELLWLAERAGELPPLGRWVEVGSWKGRSLSAVVLAAPAMADLIAVDTWEGSPGEEVHAADGPSGKARETFLDTLARLAAQRPEGPFVRDRIGESVREAEFIRDGSCDTVFLDGAHDRQSVLADLAAWTRKVKPGGLLCGHDRNEPGVSRALTEFFGPGAVEHGPGSLWFVRFEGSEVAR